MDEYWKIAQAEEAQLDRAQIIMEEIMTYEDTARFVIQNKDSLVYNAIVYDSTEDIDEAISIAIKCGYSYVVDSDTGKCIYDRGIVDL